MYTKFTICHLQHYILHTENNIFLIHAVSNSHENSEPCQSTSSNNTTAATPPNAQGCEGFIAACSFNLNLYLQSKYLLWTPILENWNIGHLFYKCTVNYCFGMTEMTEEENVVSSERKTWYFIAPCWMRTKSLNITWKHSAGQLLFNWKQIIFEPLQMSFRSVRQG